MLYTAIGLLPLVCCVHLKDQGGLRSTREHDVEPLPESATLGRVNWGRKKCPCLKNVPFSVWGEYLTEDGKHILLQDKYKLSVSYGLNQGCKAWDSDPVSLYPFCGDKQGNPKPDAPDWCQDKWCYVDVEKCPLPIKFRSAMFPNSNLFYSYETCGDGSSYTKWADDGGLDSLPDSHSHIDLDPYKIKYSDIKKFHKAEGHLDHILREEVHELHLDHIKEMELEMLTHSDKGYSDNTLIGEEIMAYAGDNDLDIVDEFGHHHKAHIVDGDELVQTDDNSASLQRPEVEIPTPSADLLTKDPTLLQEPWNYTDNHLGHEPVKKWTRVTRDLSGGETIEHFSISLWPAGVVYYDMSDKFVGPQKVDLLNAIDYLNNEMQNCDKWLPMPRGWKGGYVSIRTAPAGCFASIGYSKLHTTFLNLFPGCTFGTILHEMVHVMGTLHEQERYDRNKHIDVVESNIVPGKADQFDKVPDKENPVGRNGGFDYKSLMMYPKNAFAKKESLATIKTRPKPFVPIGQRAAPSSQDTTRLRKAYKCKSKTEAGKKWKPPHKQMFGFSSFSPLGKGVAVMRVDGISDGVQRKVAIDVCNQDGSPGNIVTLRLEANFSISSAIYCQGPASNMYFPCKRNSDCPEGATCSGGLRTRKCQVPFLNKVNMCDEVKDLCNTGKCENLIGGYLCHCRLPYYGEHCEKQLNSVVKLDKAPRVDSHGNVKTNRELHVVRGKGKKDRNKTKKGPKKQGQDALPNSANLG